MLLLVGGVGVFVVKYRFYNVLGDSMSPLLLRGDRILSDTGAAGGDGVRRGDVVMLDAAAWPAAPESAAVVKRVVAVGGDKVSYTGGQDRLEVNGRALAEEYLADGAQPAYADFAVTVPGGHVFVLGDNRPSSIDSRAHLDEPKAGAVPESAIIGRVDAVAYPFERIGALPATAVFAELGPVGERGPVLLLAGAGVLGGAALLLASGAASLVARLRRG